MTALVVVAEPNMASAGAGCDVMSSVVVMNGGSNRGINQVTQQVSGTDQCTGWILDTPMLIRPCWMPVTATFTIANNAADTYQVGSYQVYVDTKGNTQVREVRLVQ